MTGIGIIGCGLIGRKRAQALGPNWKLIACADLDLGRARALAGSEADAHADWRDLLRNPEVEAVVVATLHDSLAEITSAAIAAGKHVLVEKPAARSTAELRSVAEAAKLRKIVVRVGFNHRYHRALLKAKELISRGSLGELMYIRARYGHGGRLGYDKEWRANPAVSGGGELIDQGPHLIDLSRWFFGEEFIDINGFAHTYFWDMPVDDNSFMLLRTSSGHAAFLHVSCTEWKNTFSFEIYGRDGKIEITGLGGSYGIERLAWYKMLPEMGPPETTIWEYPMADNSWGVELEEFWRDIQSSRCSGADLSDACAALGVIEKIYEASGYDHRA